MEYNKSTKQFDSIPSPSSQLSFSDDKKVCVSGVYGFRRRLRPACKGDTRLARRGKAAAAVRAADNGA